MYCPYCTDWDLLSVRYVPHNEYPKDAPNHNNATMKKAKLITFETMINACITIHEQLYMFNWTISNAKKYAQTECIKSSIVERICSHTKSVQASRKALAQLPIPLLPMNILPSGMT